MAIDEKKVMDAFLSLKLEGGSDGLIQLSNVYLTNFYTQFWNDFSFDFETEALKIKGKQAVEEVAKVMILAAEDCALNTFHAIMTSNEWLSIVQPMVETDEDKIHGLNAIQNALGWGNIEVKEIVPKEKLVLKINSSYEAVGYQVKFGSATSGKCYMLTGVAIAFMELIYNGVQGNPAALIDAKYTATQTMGTEKGDPYGEIVVTLK
jgi:hypothetical protein